MNESIPPIIPHEVSAVAPYKNRSTGLVVFGILTLLLGCLIGLFTLLMAFSLVLPKSSSATPVNPSAILLAMSIYGSMAVAFAWLGIGSIMARRWARALLLILSWYWLLTGILMTASMPFFMAKTFENLPPNAKTGHPVMSHGVITDMIVGMESFFGVFFVLTPAIWIFFYGSRHVKTTCEVRDPVKRWTDACPLPVLGVCIWLVAGAAMLLMMPIAGHGVIPFFGIFISGLPGTLLYLLLGFLWVYAGWLLYKLDMRGWWIIVIALVAFLMSALLTYAHHDIFEMYLLMGYPAVQIEQFKKIGVLTSTSMCWMTALCSLPFLGYLLFIKKYLSGKKS